MIQLFLLDKLFCASYAAIMLIEAHNERGKIMDNLIDWKLELTLQERLTRRVAVASFVDDAGLTLALALLPWIVLIHLMF